MFGENSLHEVDVVVESSGKRVLEFLGLLLLFFLRFSLPSWWRDCHVVREL